MTSFPHVKSLALALALIAASYVSAAAADSDGSLGASKGNNGDHRTLDGGAPLVIAHRGASGYFPEETIEAYRLAIAMGVDAIEPDLVVTKDGVLVARHDVTLNTSTNVADHPEFAGRKRGGENGDGEAVAADWFVCDFTLAELKTLGAKSPNHPAAQVYDGLFHIVTFQEILDLIKLKAKEAGYVVAVYPETKNPSQPTDWKLAGLPDLFDSMLTPMGLAKIKAYADGIGPWKPMIVPVKCKLDGAGNCMDLDGNGTFDGYPDSIQQPATSLVADAHRAGLFVHEYTFRNEKGFYNVPYDAKGDPVKEYLTHYGLGVDGVFSDAADTALFARQKREGND